MRSSWLVGVLVACLVHAAQSEVDWNNPCFPCDQLPDEFLECQLESCSPSDYSLSGIHRANATCHVLPLIECYEPFPIDACTRSNTTSRNFTRTDQPCIRYFARSHLTVLLYSIFLGILGVDRFVLGYVGMGVGKLLTIGGLGVWWIVDIALIASGQVLPEDGSLYNPTL